MYCAIHVPLLSLFQMKLEIKDKEDRHLLFSRLLFFFKLFLNFLLYQFIVFKR